MHGVFDPQGSRFILIARYPRRRSALAPGFNKFLDSLLRFRYTFPMLKTLEEINARLIAVYDPERIILYGSHARGAADKDSEIVTGDAVAGADVVNFVNTNFWFSEEF